VHATHARPQDLRRIALSAAGWCLGLAAAVALNGCAALPPVTPPDVGACSEASLAASLACPAGDSNTPECLTAALRAADACRPRITAP